MTSRWRQYGYLDDEAPVGPLTRTVLAHNQARAILDTADCAAESTVAANVRNSHGDELAYWIEVQAEMARLQDARREAAAQRRLDHNHGAACNRHGLPPSAVATEEN